MNLASVVISTIDMVINDNKIEYAANAVGKLLRYLTSCMHFSQSAITAIVPTIPCSRIKFTTPFCAFAVPYKYDIIWCPLPTPQPHMGLKNITSFNVS